MKRRMRWSCLALAALAWPVGAEAQEFSGCETLRWDLSREAADLANPAIPVIESGAGADVGQAVIVRLKRWAEGALPQAPERPPRETASFAGFVSYPAPEIAGEFQAHDCPGLRKSLRFRLAAEPFAVQFSDALSEAVGLVVTGLNTGPAR